MAGTEMSSNTRRYNCAVPTADFRTRNIHIYIVENNRINQTFSPPPSVSLDIISSGTRAPSKCLFLSSSQIKTAVNTGTKDCTLSPKSQADAMKLHTNDHLFDSVVVNIEMVNLQR